MDERLALAQLHHQMNMCATVDDLMQRDDILMLYHGEDLNLVLQRLGRLRTFDVLLFVDLQSARMPGLAVDRAVHAGKGALTDLEYHLEVGEFEDLLICGPQFLPLTL